ncbi:DUF2169 domain-containing protein [Roseibium sp. AS2]|uniref:DUF2169 family type VI secretion system accessory protein n=2 Tax=unclassified Roseibium TaxID=2629323 RepID=UPI003179D369
MPAIIKPSRISSSLHTQVVEGGSVLTASAFLLFDVARPFELYTEQALWPMVVEQMPDGGIFDKGQLKPRAEMIVAGHALAPHHQPVTGLKVTARLGDKVKRLAVFGNRFWRLTDQGIEIVGPEPFDKMPISEIHAFGGEGFPMNPKGKGFGALKLVEAGIDAPLPNIENGAALILSPGDTPHPAHFGPIGPDNPDRLKLAGTFDKHWVDHVSPLRPDDFNPLFNCDAPADQRFDGFLKGGETFSVTGMCRSGQPVGGVLPGFRVRAFIQRKTDGSLTETSMVCDTATLFPNVGKAVMAFRGLVKSTDRLGEDIGAVLLAVEHSDAAPRPADYYQHVFQLRTDPEQAYKHALSDHQLMPETDPAILVGKRQERMDRAIQDRRKFLEDSDWMVRKKLDEAGVPTDILPPADPDRGADIPMIGLPTPEEFASGDFDIAEMIEDVERLEKELTLKADQEMARAELLRRDAVAAAPLEIRDLMDGRPFASDEQIAAANVSADPALEPGLNALADMPVSLKQTFADNIDPEKVNDRSAEAQTRLQEALDKIDNLAQHGQADETEQHELACARALRRPEGSLLYPIRRQLGELELDTQAVPSSLLDPMSALSGDTRNELNLAPLPDGSPGSEDPEKVDFFAALSKAGQSSELGTEAAEDELAQALGPTEALLRAQFPHLIESGMEDQPLAGVMGKLEAMDLPEVEDAHMPISDRFEQVNEEMKSTLDELEPRLAETLTTGRQMSPQAMFPQEAMLPAVALSAGKLVAEKLAEGHDFKGADLAGLSLRGLDFSNRDLSGTFFEQADLTGACFKGCHLDGAVFTSANLEGADFRSSNLGGANFSAAKLTHANLGDATLSNCLLIGADLSGTVADSARLIDVTFLDCTLDGTILKESQLEQVKVAKGSAVGLDLSGAALDTVVFIDLPMTRSDFTGSRFNRAAFTNVSAADSNFTSAELHETGFQGGCDLSRARFEAVTATDTCWNGAKLEESLYLKASCQSCLFIGCNMQSVDGRTASFKKARFMQSDLRYSDFCAADFFAASLSQSDLRQVSMRHASLFGADLMDSRLASCDLSHANLGGTAMNQAVQVAAQ